MSGFTESEQAVPVATRASIEPYASIEAILQHTNAALLELGRERLSLLHAPILSGRGASGRCGRGSVPMCPFDSVTLEKLRSEGTLRVRVGYQRRIGSRARSASPTRALS